ncbi:hypothetical protein CACET_c31870 [Clostridium aceticum]|uniref:Uncharacterized protein n=1 Tax=Clostridium aceticum TaxID=84022 RepID=A0A0G3WDB2_9CLOT|nr:hypothetical protein [Clostridium aceticum]AKL96631.1 hypothetical protein CACET_c31870 [Clostridium aceticum]
MDKKIDTIISKLDTAAGMLIVAAMKDQTVKKAMRLISESSFELGNLIGGGEIEWEKIS